MDQVTAINTAFHSEYEDYCDLLSESRIHELIEAAAQNKEIVIVSSRHGRNLTDAEIISLAGIIISALKLAWDIISTLLKQRPISSLPSAPDVVKKLRTELPESHHEAITTEAFARAVDTLIINAHAGEDSRGNDIAPDATNKPTS
jgi:hypothetical protein